MVVRIVSDKYKEGKWYNKKVFVRNIPDLASFIALPYDKASGPDYTG